MENEITDLKAEKTPDINQTISAMNDSVNLINDLLASNDVSEETKGTIDRNVRHLDLMVEKDFVKNSGKDLSLFTKASTDGKAFLTANPLAPKTK